MKKSSRRALEVEMLESVMLRSTVTFVTFATVSQSLVSKASHLAKATPVTQTSQVQVNARASQAGLTASRPVTFSKSIVTPTARSATSTVLPTSFSSMTVRSQASRTTGNLPTPSITQVSQVHAMVLPGGKPVTITQPTNLTTVSLPSTTRVASSAAVGNVGGGIKFV